MDSPRPRKVLFVINVMALVGGAEVQLGILAKGLRRRGYEVTIACISHGHGDLSSLTELGIEIVEFGYRKRSRRWRAIPRLTRMAREAEIVHCTMWDPSLWGRIAAILARRPVIVADHATDRKVQVAQSGAPRARWIALHNRLLDPFTFATVACARSQRAVLLSEGVSPEKIVHIPNGIPVADVLERAKGVTRAEIGVADGAPMAMQVGLFRIEKNQLGALEAFAEVRRRVTDAELVFVGTGPLREGVEERAEELGAGAWVHFLGERGDVPALLSLADLMLLPSHGDAMPMTVLEAMALGVPVLASDVGDVRGVLGEGGVCIPPGDPAALAGESARLLADPAARRRLGAIGSSRAPEFDAAAMTRSYASLFEAALTGAEPRAAWLPQDEFTSAVA
ncbi:MAG: glycosyltransferase [Solirubrobacterales bacterium]